MDSREPRVLTVPEVGDGMRLDRFLAKRFRDRSRAWCAKGIRDKEVCDAHDRPLRAAHRVRAGDVLHLYLKGIAPSAPPPPLPPILHEDDRVLVVNKPAGLLTHPAGTDFVYSLIGLLKEQHPGQHVNLIHRIDRDTSGALLIAKDLEADRFLKERFVQGEVSKAYDALVRSPVAWDQIVVDAPIGPKGEVIRIRRMVRDDGLDAKTTFSVLGRNDALTHIRCMIHTGRTHQIRVHLEHLGLPIIGDRLYGVPPEVFLHAYDHGADRFVMEQTGAPRQALHARRLRVEHPDGGILDVEAPMPEDMASWWNDPTILPFGETTDSITP